MNDSPERSESVVARGTVAEVAGAFLKLGFISFGGPVAHLGYFHDEFVDRRRWIDDAAYAELVALCQFLPGPASSQVAFALGMRRAGILGAMAASCCFLAPSAILMIAFAYGVTAIGDLASAGWIHGLKLAAVAVVAQAVLGMWRRLCPDRSRASICLAGAGAVLLAPGALAQVGVIAAGAVAGWLAFRRRVDLPPPDDRATARGHFAAIAALCLFVVLLVGLPLVANATGSRELVLFDAFYRSGSLVFGGGHVVLPLLRAEVVPRGWVSDEAFLAGYGAAQALPGPLFAFAGYLGAMIGQGSVAGPGQFGRFAQVRWLGGLWCTGAIFLPAWLLIGGALPFWHRLRAKRWAQAALRGANAAVVGVLLAALYTPVCTEGIRDARDLAAALIAFGLLQTWRVPAIAIVALCAGAGEWFLR